MTRKSGTHILRMILPIVVQEGNQRQPASVIPIGSQPGGRAVDNMVRDERRHKSRSTGVSVTLGAASHIGKHRMSNQDAYCAFTGQDAPGGLEAYVAVADGMGGHRAGEVASALAVQKLTRRLARRRPGPAPGGDERPALQQDVEYVNDEIHRAGMAPEFQGMGTTLTAGLLIGKTLVLAHVGDSRAYVMRNGQLTRLTTDHSWTEEQITAGLLSPQDAAGHPRRNQLTRALGIAPNVEVDTLAVPLQPKDLFLFCTDGLHAMVDEKDIARVLRDKEPQAACDALIERANARGGNDNITVIVLRLDELASNDGNAPINGRARGRGFLEGTFERLRKAMNKKQATPD